MAEDIAASRLPDWIRIQGGRDQHATKSILRRHGLATVCEEARCPNRGVCFGRPAAAFMILGSLCTRNCGFCSVHPGTPSPVDPEEPANLAEAAAELGLSYVVITSVTRDDLPDGGANQFAKSIVAVRRRLASAKVEVLTPDFLGDERCIETVLREKPDVFNHNIETIKRLYPSVRPSAEYARSLRVLRYARDAAPDVLIKSGFMLGLGETMDEVRILLVDLREAGCDLVTIGQYLRPSRKNIPVVEYIRPEVFVGLQSTALRMGFKSVASGPLVRSSMNAEDMFEHV